jgi:radical SAM superfamily enzyme YgiQ (UPF0313 family)
MWLSPRKRKLMKVHLINPSDKSFGTAVVTPRWLYVLAAATPRSYGDPRIVDECLESLDIATIGAGDVVGIGIHTTNAYRGYEIGKLVRDRGAYVVYGGIHATLYPQEAMEIGGAHAVVQGDGDMVWSKVLEDCSKSALAPLYNGGRVDGGSFASARWELIPRKRYMWASVQTLRGCPKHCSFCSVWRTDGQKPRQRTSDAVIEELVQLRRLGFRFIVLADDNFYPVTLQDLQLAERQKNAARTQELQAIREERFLLMERMAKLPSDMVFFTQITMEAAEDPEFLKAMKAARIRGVLVGVEAVTPEGLKDVYKDFNAVGEALVEQLQKFRQHGVYVLGSFIFGLPSDRPETFQATADLANRAELAFAQFVTLTPFPGTVDFHQWEKSVGDGVQKIAGVPITRRWLIPPPLRPKIYWPHPVMSAEEIRERTQAVWDEFYSWGSIWKRSNFIRSKGGRLAFLLISRIYRHMYADTGIATDSARVAWSTRWTRMLAKPCQLLFAGQPMPDLAIPDCEPSGIRIRPSHLAENAS